MRKSDIEKRLKRELTQAAPSDFDAIKRKCGIPLDSAQKTAKGVFAVEGGGVQTVDKRTLFMRIGAACLAAVLLLGVLLGVMLRGGFAKKGAGGAAGYFIIDINPSIEVAYDKKGIIQSARGLNEDGEILLLGTELAGKTCEETADVLFEQCVKLGYFSAERTDNALLISATTENGEKDEKMTKRAKTLFDTEFTEHKICGVAITGVEDPALKEEGEKYGVDAQKYALIQELLALGGTLNETEYAEVSIRELYALIQQLTKEKAQEILQQKENEKCQAEQALYEKVSASVNGVKERVQFRIDLFDSGKDTEEDGYVIQYYKNCLKQIDAHVGQLQQAKENGDLIDVCEMILSDYKDLKNKTLDLLLAMYLEGVCKEIAQAIDVAKEKIHDLDKADNSVEEKHENRVDKFEGKGEGVSDDEFEKWKEENKGIEDQYKEAWYEKKKEWEKDRLTELDD